MSRPSPPANFGKTSVFSLQGLDEIFLVFHQKFYLIVYYSYHCEKKFSAKAISNFFLQPPNSTMFGTSLDKPCVPVF